MVINPLGAGPDPEIRLREAPAPDKPLTLPPVDEARPGQFVQELLDLAERHAAATGAASAAPGLLLAATVAAAERYGQGVGIGVQLIECGGLLRDRTWQRMADQMSKGETAGA